MITGEDIKHCPPGLYKICWKNGESAIGIIAESRDASWVTGTCSLLDDNIDDPIDYIELLELHKPRQISVQQIKNCELGLYEVYWVSGGSSLAAVGNHHDGVRWLACCNWTAEPDKNPSGRIDDNMLARIKCMELVKGMPPWRLVDE